jgi:hypothetical protein
MSALGQKQTSEPVRSMSALPPKADIDRGAIHSCNEQWLSSACGRLVACHALTQLIAALEQGTLTRIKVRLGAGVMIARSDRVAPLY